MTPAHTCVPSSNPRFTRSCGRCGKLLPEPLKRNPEFECELTRHAASGLNVDAEALNILAGRRADAHAAEYAHDFPDLDRDLEREATEELLDARNYVVWRLDAIHRGLDEDEWKVAHLQIALRHVALAFEELRRVGG